MEKLEETGRLIFIDDSGDESSGVRENPLTAHLRELERLDDGSHDRGSGAPPANVAQDLDVEGVAARVLKRFERLHGADRGAIVEAALARLVIPASAPRGAAETRLAHAIFSEAVALDRRRWMEGLAASPAEVMRELALAKQRAAALSGREKRIFVAVSALDDVAYEEEGGKVMLRAAVAFQVRWNTAHQNVSRAWRKICGGGPLAAWSRSFRAGHAFVCGPPAPVLWEAARAYMDVCSGRGGHAGEGFAAWVDAHAVHNAWFNEWKKHSARTARCWREFAVLLDASGVTPGAIQGSLVRSCAALGIDRCVVPAKLAQQSWRELLAASHRPAPAARVAWPAFLRENGFGPDTEAAFRELEQHAVLTDVARVELQHAYQCMLAAAERQSSATSCAREAFRRLIDVSRIAEVDNGDQGDELRSELLERTLDRPAHA